MSERYAVIGQPVAHSKSPWIHAQFARATRQDMEYGCIEAPLGGFTRAADEFRVAGGKGLNVTLPFKEDAHQYCTQLSPRARDARAVNTIRFGAETFGDNTDGVGLVRDFATLGADLRGSRVLLMGAGGAARGVVGALVEAGVARLTIANRNESRAREVATRFSGVSASGYEALKPEFEYVINATSAGLAGASPGVPQDVLARAKLAYDMVYGRDTPFLAAARAVGVPTSDGMGMLVEQAAESFFLWRGVRPETAPVLRELRGR
jgi:shikimate dehydrogenase